METRLVSCIKRTEYNDFPTRWENNLNGNMTATFADVDEKLFPTRWENNLNGNRSDASMPIKRVVNFPTRWENNLNGNRSLPTDLRKQAQLSHSLGEQVEWKRQYLAAGGEE